MDRTSSNLPPLQRALSTAHDRESVTDEYELDATAPIDRSKYFICPTSTPLYYAAVYSSLSEQQRRRYNQLTAICFNELVAMVETNFAGTIINAVLRKGRAELNDELTEELLRFDEEERRHAELWYRLNQLSEPVLCGGGNRVFVCPPPLARRSMSLLTSMPHRFPAVFWIMLALEERSIDVSRRCLKMDRDQIEPRYRFVHARHLKDESRHVQIDRQLIERFYAARSRVTRQWNGRLFQWIMERFFYRPERAAVRVVRRLTLEFSELEPLEPVMIRQLAGLCDDPAYSGMMYSQQTTPLFSKMLDQYPEMRPKRWDVADCADVSKVAVHG